MTAPTRVFLDTNVFIIGAAFKASPEARILHWIGYGTEQPSEIELVVSQELFEQILRVGRRVHTKDWGAAIVGRLWADVNLRYVIIPAQDVHQMLARDLIPREDIGMYLTALHGQAECFVSSNHVLIRALCQKTGDFECLTPDEFLKKYLKE